MRLTLAILVAIAGVVVADVAHLSRNYLPPARTLDFNSARGFSGKLTQAIPAALTSYTGSTSFNTGFSAPSQAYFAPPQPAKVTIQASQSFIPPISYTTRKFNSAQVATIPSRQYLSPEVETFEPIVQQPFSAPAAAYNAPASGPAASFTSASNLDTKYAADGGYVY